MTRDDLVTGTIAGPDTIKATVMGTLFHLLEPGSLSWRQQIPAEINQLQAETRKYVCEAVACTEAERIHS